MVSDGVFFMVGFSLKPILSMICWIKWGWDNLICPSAWVSNFTHKYMSILPLPAILYFVAQFGPLVSKDILVMYSLTHLVLRIFCCLRTAGILYPLVVYTWVNLQLHTLTLDQSLVDVLVPRASGLLLSIKILLQLRRWVFLLLFLLNPWVISIFTWESCFELSLMSCLSIYKSIGNSLSCVACFPVVSKHNKSQIFWSSINFLLSFHIIVMAIFVIPTMGNTSFLFSSMPATNFLRKNFEIVEKSWQQCYHKRSCTGCMLFTKSFNCKLWVIGLTNGPTFNSCLGLEGVPFISLPSLSSSSCFGKSRQCLHCVDLKLWLKILVVVFNGGIYDHWRQGGVVSNFLYSILYSCTLPSCPYVVRLHITNRTWWHCHNVIVVPPFITFYDNQSRNKQIESWIFRIWEGRITC